VRPLSPESCDGYRTLHFLWWDREVHALPRERERFVPGRAQLCVGWNVQLRSARLNGALGVSRPGRMQEDKDYNGAGGLMMQKLGDIVSERALAAFTGRAREVEGLLQLFEQGGPLALYVHGVAGIGKSSLLEVFAARVRATGGRVVRIDCRTV